MSRKQPQRTGPSIDDIIAEAYQVTDTFGLVVERIDDNQTHLGIPDTRGGYHQIQIANIHLQELKELIDGRLWDEEQREILRTMRLKFERRKDEPERSE